MRISRSFHVERCELTRRAGIWRATLSHLEFRGGGDVRCKCSTWNNFDSARAEMFRCDFVPRGTWMLSRSSLRCLSHQQLLFHVEHEFKPPPRPVKGLLQRGKPNAAVKMLPGNDIDASSLLDSTQRSPRIALLSCRYEEGTVRFDPTSRYRRRDWGTGMGSCQSH